MWFRDRDDVADVEPDGDEGLLMNHRIARKPTTATARICGMLIEVEASFAMVFVGGLQGEVLVYKGAQVDS